MSPPPGVSSAGGGELQKCGSAAGNEDRHAGSTSSLASSMRWRPASGMLQGTDGFVKAVQDNRSVSEDIIERTGKHHVPCQRGNKRANPGQRSPLVDVTSEISPSLLERTKSSSQHGNDGEIFHFLFLNPGKLPDGNNVYAHH